MINPEQLLEERAYTLGTGAYLWGFTMNELYRVRSHALAKPGAAVNTFAHSRALLTPEAARKGGVVRFDQKKNTLVLENYASEPVRLQSVKVKPRS